MILGFMFEAVLLWTKKIINKSSSHIQGRGNKFAVKILLVGYQSKQDNDQRKLNK
jgi:hypothetical protein